MVDIARVTWSISKRLFLWSTGSIFLGVAMALSPRSLIEGIGLQMIIWGAIDAVIALAGLSRARKLYRLAPEEHRAVHDSLRLRRLLIINGRLDILYLITGIAVLSIFRHDPFLLGNGIGVVFQSVFLLIFDHYHAALLPGRAPAWYDDAS